MELEAAESKIQNWLSAFDRVSFIPAVDVISTHVCIKSWIPHPRKTDSYRKYNIPMLIPHLIIEE
jgi:hypothetical protein